MSTGNTLTPYQVIILMTFYRQQSKDFAWPLARTPEDSDVSSAIHNLLQRGLLEYREQEGLSPTQISIKGGVLCEHILKTPMPVAIWQIPTGAQA